MNKLVILLVSAHAIALAGSVSSKQRFENVATIASFLCEKSAAQLNGAKCVLVEVFEDNCTKDWDQFQIHVLYSGFVVSTRFSVDPLNKEGESTSIKDKWASTHSYLQVLPHNKSGIPVHSVQVTVFTDRELQGYANPKNCVEYSSLYNVGEVFRASSEILVHCKDRETHSKIQRGTRFKIVEVKDEISVMVPSGDVCMMSGIDLALNAVKVKE